MFLPGHLESKSSIKRVLAITTVLSLAYSVTQVRTLWGRHCLEDFLDEARTGFMKAEQPLFCWSWTRAGM